MSQRQRKKPHGQIRQSQVVTTFGPGSLVELPKYSVLVAGLEHWSKGGAQVHEPRLLEKLKALLGTGDLELYSPPPASDDIAAPVTGIPVFQFPQWFIAQDAEDQKGSATVRSRLLVHQKALANGKFIDQDKKKRAVVPVRFVRACRRGHVGDIDWRIFVHRGPTQCTRQLWMDERGTSGDLSEIRIRCECGVPDRPLNDAALLQLRALGTCDGARPWLGQYSREACGEPSRLLVRTASNAYFPQIMSVISLPDRDEELTKVVTQVWDYLEAAESPADVERERKKAAVKKVLEPFSDQQVFQEIQARKGDGLPTSTKSVKQAEIETLTAITEEVGNDRPDGDFYARALPATIWNQPWMNVVERVVLVHRLREVVAQVGFTRFEVSAPDIQGELEMGVTRALLAREVTWLPAIENRGEGIYIGFKKSAIKTWLAKNSIRKRGESLTAGFENWKFEHQGTKREFPGLPYMMLHSLSHLLITAVALECGYPASSIRERVYAGDSGYGILLYTGSPDAEGTLGGLVEVGRQIHQHVKAALELGKLCSNDPVCAQHEPPNTNERRFLHGAACHGCLLIAETSCEQRNDFLDRALVLPTLANLGAEFFPGVAQ